MTQFSPDSYFDLSNYFHASIFHKQQYVWQTLNFISSYLNSVKLGKIEIDIPSGAFLVDPHLISIGKNSVVEPGAYIKGPCLIGDHCTVRHGAYIRGNFICGNACVIGHDSEIKNSVFLNNVHAAHFAYVGDSILGNHVNLGAGTKCANLKFDHQTIFIDFEGNRINTGLRKFGAIIGDNSQMGCNSVLNPGTLLGSCVFCYPLVNVSGVIPAHSLVKNQNKNLITPYL